MAAPASSPGSRCRCSAPPGLARRPAAAAQPPADRDPGAARPAPRGAVVEQLHALLYGDQSVTLSTLKAEVSHLRAALGGQLASRPYRLMLPLTTDVETVLGLLRQGDVVAAVAAYGGDLLPGTNSPALDRARRLRRGRGARGAARRPAPRGGPAVRRVRAVRHRGAGGGAHRPRTPRAPGQGTAQGPAGRSPLTSRPPGWWRPRPGRPGS